MCLQEILQQNAAFNSFRKELISKSKYFPEVIVMFQSDTCICACTIARKKHDGFWYKIPVITPYYTNPDSPIQDLSFLFQKNIVDAYMAMTLTVISDKIVDVNGEPIFIKDDLQLDEEQRLILETKILRNNI